MRPEPHTAPDGEVAPPVPRAIGALCAPLYALAVRARNRRFDSGRGVNRVGVPVISVGNLSAGGTGKSPMVLWLARLVQEMGARPGVATRGYKARPGQLGDEQREMLERMPDLPIEADPSRTTAATRLVSRGCDVVLMDDGFQHRALARDLDIVLIDATRPTSADRLLPAGYLREPARSLVRAHAVVITRCESVASEVAEEIERFVSAFNPRLVVARAEHQWNGLVMNDEPAPIDRLAGKAVVAACGIGNPSVFLSNARVHGARIVADDIQADHHDWSEADAVRLRGLCESHGAALLTTGKDLVKLREHLHTSMRGVDAIIPDLSIGFTRGEPELTRLVSATLERAAAGDG